MRLETRSLAINGVREGIEVWPSLLRHYCSAGQLGSEQARRVDGLSLVSLRIFCLVLRRIAVVDAEKALPPSPPSSGGHLFELF